jgi:hypothetical protein
MFAAGLGIFGQDSKVPQAADANLDAAEPGHSLHELNVGN